MVVENKTTNRKTRDNSVYQTDEYRKKMSKISKERYSSLSASRKQEISKKISQKTKEGILKKYGSSEKFKEEKSKTTKEMWKDPSYREKTSAAIKEHYNKKPDTVRYSFIKGKTVEDSIYESKSNKKGSKYSLPFSEVFF